MEWQNLAFQATVDGNPTALGAIETPLVPAVERPQYPIPRVILRRRGMAPMVQRTTEPPGSDLKSAMRSMDLSSPEAEEVRSWTYDDDPTRSTAAKPRLSMERTRIEDHSNSRSRIEDQSSSRSHDGDQEASTDPDPDTTRGAELEGQEDMVNPVEQPSASSTNDSETSIGPSHPEKESGRLGIHPVDQIDGDGAQETAMTRNQDTRLKDEVRS
ncbi:unnamed protein product [Phytophthora fragariaefolia]|uniref:Unnamed protein product n=1 Tax=Phytophthora fragariaefolia TaxID=1490495 RepID=A0A9W6XW95_9STRA|nr:unnamed protein product [Phytophthora fragariaefolia]